MATSRSNIGQPNDYGLGTPATGATDSRQSSVGGGTSTSTGTGSTSGTSTTSTNSTTKNMSDANTAALNQLIQQLLSGGTAEQKQQKAIRDQEISTTRSTRADYTHDSAFADAAGLIAQQTRRTMEQLLPSINRAAEDAGSSGGALRALLLQDAANKAAESGSALGVQTAAQYGGINANLSQVLEQLTRIDPTVTNSLIAALNTSKGAITEMSGTSTTNNSGTTTETKSGATTENKNVNTDYAPFSNVVSNGQRNNSPIYFGPEGNGPQVAVGSTMDTLIQLAGGGNGSWSNYTF